MVKRIEDAAVTPLGLAVLAELNRRGYSLDNPPPDDVFDAVAAELRERPVAEQELARVVRRFGGS
jgi:hypothetical protein